MIENQRCRDGDGPVLGDIAGDDCAGGAEEGGYREARGIGVQRFDQDSAHPVVQGIGA
jgi:hypothetical protein